MQMQMLQTHVIIGTLKNLAVLDSVKECGD